MNETTERVRAAAAAKINGNDTQEQILQNMADDLMTRATAARKAGDTAAAAKLLRAAAEIMGDTGADFEPAERAPRGDARRQTTPETEKIKGMLRERWCEAHELQEATGLNANRVHSLLGRLKNSRDLKFEKRTMTQYRLVP